jgi:hypothetical protein
MKTRKRKALGDLEGLCHVLAGLASSGGDHERLEALAPVINVSTMGTLGESMPHQIAAAIFDGLMGKRVGLRGRVAADGRRRRLGQHVGPSAPRCLARRALRSGHQGLRRCDRGLAHMGPARTRSWFRTLSREFDALARAGGPGGPTLGWRATDRRRTRRAAWPRCHALSSGSRQRGDLSGVVGRIARAWQATPGSLRAESGRGAAARAKRRLPAGLAEQYSEPRLDLALQAGHVLLT